MPRISTYTELTGFAGTEEFILEDAAHDDYRVKANKLVYKAASDGNFYCAGPLINSSANGWTVGAVSGQPRISHSGGTFSLINSSNASAALSAASAAFSGGLSAGTVTVGSITMSYDTDFSNIDFAPGGNALWRFYKTGKYYQFFIDGVNRCELSAGGIAPYSTTTASAANLYQASSGSGLLRSTSSERYKDQIELADPEMAARALEIPVIWYRSKAEADDPAHSYWGVTAEDAAEIDPRLVHYDYLESDYELVEEGEAVVQVTERRLVSVSKIEVVEGKAVARIVEEEQDVPVFDEFPMFDAAGDPVMAQVGVEIVVGKDGAEIEQPVFAQQIHREARTVKRPLLVRRLKPGAVKVPDGAQYERINLLRTEALKNRIVALEAALSDLRNGR